VGLGIKPVCSSCTGMLNAFVSAAVRRLTHQLHSFVVSFHFADLILSLALYSRNSE